MQTRTILAGVFCGAVSFAASLFFASSGQAAQFATLTPTQDGLFLLEAEIEGQTGMFLVDTGAGISAIEPGFALKAGVDGSGARRRLYGLTQVEAFPTIRAEVRSGLAGRRVADIALLRQALPYPAEADGLLGLNALLPDEDGVLEIDFPSGIMRFHEPDDAPVPLLQNAWLEIHAPADHADLILTPISVEGIAGEALIDTGLPFIVMNRAYAEALEQHGQRQAMELTGFSQEGATPEILRVRRIRLGPVLLLDSAVYVLDAPVFGALGLAETPVLILGAPAFQNLKLLIDTEARRFTAAPPDYFGERSAACTGSRISCPASTTRLSRTGQ